MLYNKYIMKLEHYSRSCETSTNKAIINAGVSNDNVKIIDLNQVYNLPRFFPRKIGDWPDTFEVTLINNNQLKIRRSDVLVGGWGSTLLIDVEYKDNNIKDIQPLTEQKIPRVIYQTFETYDVPDGLYKAMQSFKDINYDYEHYYFSNEDRIKFIEEHFSSDVLYAYLTLIPGAFKADLWRCCILYIKGGIYVDSDMICLKPFRELITKDDIFIAARDDPMSKIFICNGFIASIPRHPFMKEQIDSIVNNVKIKKRGYYLDLTGPALLGKTIHNVCGVLDKNRTDFELGINKLGDYTFRLLFHDWTTKTIRMNNISIIYTEYPEKNNEMRVLKLPTYYDLWKNDILYQIIPRNIYYTAKDCMDINDYMVQSFTKKNPYWKINYNDDDNLLSCIRTNNQLLISELGVDVLAYYLSLTNGGEKTDLWRYCIIYLFGGVYADSDTYCNVPLDNWIKHHDLILGIEANLDLEYARQFGMDKIGYTLNNKVISVCNWSFAAMPKHIFFKNLIIDICLNPIANNVLNNTGPGRITKHAVSYFSGSDLLLLEKQDIEKDKSILFNINKFGSNQCHSGAYKNFSDPFDCSNEDIYIVHMFTGSWRFQYPNKKMTEYEMSKLGLSHNLTIMKTTNGYSGISRLDKDTSRTNFMKCIGDCRSLLEITFDNNLDIISEVERPITNYNNIAKFEDFRYFSFNNKSYLSVSYIDINFNTKVAILDENYKFLGDVIIDIYNKVSFGTPDRHIWEKNWLFLEKDGQLYFIYSTMPRYIVYKCNDFSTLQFSKYIDNEWTIPKNVPKNEVYFTTYIGSDIKISTGGSTNPIYIKEKDVYIYLIHTKLNYEWRYNHYMVILDKNLIPIDFCQTAIVNKYINKNLCFIMTMIEIDNYLVLSGGVSDKHNFTWKLSKEKIFKMIGI
uniref:Alpha 1,4-glycosyltransferase domain-containing protein n=1 Tax=viral metagenome TaxID=1070528 RepID=A0A6C0II63_9ZZZZ